VISGLFKINPVIFLLKPPIALMNADFTGTVDYVLLYVQVHRTPMPIASDRSLQERVICTGCGS
jgi:hypothetical protein